MTTTCLPCPPLHADAVARFHDQGFHVLPGFLAPALCHTLKAEIDQFVAAQQAPVDPYATAAPARLQLEYHEHGLLLTEPRLMAMLRQFMGGSEFSLHHLHTARHDAGCHGVNWHHDYEQIPQTNRSHLMVHVFFYLNGLDGTIGDLLVQPRSHRRVMERNALDDCGTGDLPGTLVFDDLPPGSAVIVHSALLHARRPKPGGETNPRYFIDGSYCQAGVAWPSYGSEHRTRMLPRAKELGLGRGGAFDFVFDSERFYDSDPVWSRFQRANHGSLALQIA